MLRWATPEHVHVEENVQPTTESDIHSFENTASLVSLPLKPYCYVFTVNADIVWTTATVRSHVGCCRRLMDTSQVKESRSNEDEPWEFVERCR